MTWIKAGIGTIATLVGLVWTGQGLGFIGGKTMSGHPIYAALGLVVALIGVWLLRSALRSRAQAATL
jgi:hypothetical protein